MALSIIFKRYCTRLKGIKINNANTNQEVIEDIQNKVDFTSYALRTARVLTDTAVKLLINHI